MVMLGLVVVYYILILPIPLSVTHEISQESSYDNKTTTQQDTK